MVAFLFQQSICVCADCMYSMRSIMSNAMKGKQSPACCNKVLVCVYCLCTQMQRIVKADWKSDVLQRNSAFHLVVCAELHNCSDSTMKRLQPTKTLEACSRKVRACIGNPSWWWCFRDSSNATQDSSNDFVRVLFFTSPGQLPNRNRPSAEKYCQVYKGQFYWAWVDISFQGFSR